MRMRLALCALALLLAAPAQAGERTKVAVAQGELSGEAADAGIVRHLGVPFAAPPVGDLRWRPTQPAAAWTGVRDATRTGPACPQPAGAAAAGGGRPGVQSEDCLYLNVWAPAGAKDLPVMVWIYGGAYRLGSASYPVYDGRELAKQGVVVVAINYRIGLLGFFAHPSLTAEAGPDAPLGNYGLMDQLAGLRWVQDNIAALGGDPKRVTVFGESAGGGSILHLLTLPQARGLFSAAIVESGGGLTAPAPLARAEATGGAIAEALGLPRDATAAQLRQATPDALVQAAGQPAGVNIGPFLDGRLVTVAPWRVFRSGQAIDVPLLIGANSNEASVMTALGVPLTAASTFLGDDKARIDAAYGAATPEAERNRQVMGDAWFVGPARWVAAQAASGKPSYLYHFDYVAEARRGMAPGANHGSEIPYVFKSWAAMPQLAAALGAQDRKVSDTVSACWVAFAKTGAPACPGAPAWPAYSPDTDALMHFGETPTVRANFRKAQIDLLLEEFFRKVR